MAVRTIGILARIGPIYGRISNIPMKSASNSASLIPSKSNPISVATNTNRLVFNMPER